MACYHPLRGYRDPATNGFTSKRFGSGGERSPLTVPCGQCIGCRLERSRQWAVRCMHEAQMHERNCFITLTYDNVNLPVDLSLDYRHFQLFMKRLRTRFYSGIRFYMCGEYGEQFGRPHFHALLFNFDFDDKYHWANRNGNPSFRSSVLDGLDRGVVDRSLVRSDALWPYGNAEIGAVTFQSAAYIARYVMKKVTGRNADDHYFNPDTGSFRKPEFNCMSRRGGIGKSWIEQFSSDVYPSDFVVVNGVKCKPPRYYDNYFKSLDPLEFEDLKYTRECGLGKYVDNNTSERLNVRERVAQARMTQLKRSIV